MLMRKLSLKACTELRVIHAGPATGKETARTVINLLGGSVILLEEFIQAIDPLYYENRLWRFPEHADRGLEIMESACSSCLAVMEDNPRTILITHVWDPFVVECLKPMLSDGKADLTVHHNNPVHLHWKLSKRSPSAKSVSMRQCSYWVEKWLENRHTMSHFSQSIVNMDAGLLDVLIAIDLIDVESLTSDKVRNSAFHNPYRS